MPTLQTERLDIRPVSPADWPAFLRIAESFERSPYVHTDHPWPTVPEGAQRITHWFASGPGNHGVILREAGTMVGQIGFAEHSPGEWSLGYRFDDAYSGQGYATEACQALVDDAFRQRAAVKIEAGTALINGPSVRLLGRLGLMQVGAHTESYREDAQGLPLEFQRGLFELAREMWARGQGE